MATYKTGKIAVGKIDVGMDIRDLPLINSEILPPGSISMPECYDFSAVGIENAADMSVVDINSLLGQPCIYDPSAVDRSRRKEFLPYTGKVYLLPVSKDRLLSDTLATGESIALLNVVIIVGSDTGQIWDGNYEVRKFQYYVSTDAPLTIAQALIATKACSGITTVDNRICNLPFDKIPGGSIKGKDLGSYQIPWYQADGKPSTAGRPMDWNKTFGESGIKDGESVFCQLYRAGNKLAAYGGAGAPNWRDFGIDYLLGAMTPR